MNAATADKKHLAPLLEFLRYVSERGKNQRVRFPRRINGVGDQKAEAYDSAGNGDSIPILEEFHYGVFYNSSNDRSPSTSRDDVLVIPPARDRGKRSRSEDEASEIMMGPNAPISCELDSMVAGKGCFTSKYIDFSLLDLGVEPIIASIEEDITKDVAKQLQGTRCCYVVPGTSMVVTGDIVDVSLASQAVLVSPDRGIRVSLGWVSIRRVFHVPKNISAVREEVSFRIQRIVNAERRGEKTPIFSPVQLGDNTESFPSFPSS